MSIAKYKVEARPLCPAESMITGEHYRISVLTPSLVRLEYAEDGIFEDRATQSVWFRDFEPVEFKVYDNKEELSIYTEYLEIHYDRKAFTPSGLSIKVNGSLGSNSATWHYGEEPQDLLGTARTLDCADGSQVINGAAFFTGGSVMTDPYIGKVPMEHGIMSRMSFSYFDDSKSMTLEENGWIKGRKDGIQDLYFFGYGNRYLEALKDFYHLCGKQPLLPRYAFGNWWSRYHRYDEKEYMDLITRFEREKLPFSVAVVDMDWHLVDDVDPKYGSGWTGYTWNPEFFPDPVRFMNWLHEHNLKITLNVHPADGIRAFEKLYPRVAEAMGIDPASEIPVDCDPADPKFMEVYFDELHHPLEEEGVDFWWIDWQQGSVTKEPGLDPLWVFNHYHFQDSAWKGNRPMTFSRYAGVGSHRYPVGFSGDTLINWESLDFQPYFTATASNIGYGWWSHDIGGHMLGSKDDELMARWVELGVFSPINRLHSSDNPFSGKEPWKFNRSTRATMEKFLRLRHALVPYLYSMNHRANYDDQPLVWPMYYQEPSRQEAYEVGNEFYFGSELIVSAITKPQDPAANLAEAKTWIPEGLWADFFTGMIYEGGRKTSLWRGTEDYPVLMKAGAIVPMKNLDNYDSSTENPAALEVKIFPAASGSFTLWEDAGDTPVDAPENWAATELSYDADKAAFTINFAIGNTTVIPEKRSWKLTFLGMQDTELAVSADGEQIKAPVTYDAYTGALTVEIPELPISTTITVTAANAFALRENPIADYCSEILQNACMNFEQKRTTYNTILKETRKLASRIRALELPAAVCDALLEVIEAN